MIKKIEYLVLDTSNSDPANLICRVGNFTRVGPIGNAVIRKFITLNSDKIFGAHPKDINYVFNGFGQLKYAHADGKTISGSEILSLPNLNYSIGFIYG